MLSRYLVCFVDPERHFDNDPMPATVVHTGDGSRVKVLWDNGFSCKICIDYLIIRPLAEEKVMSKMTIPEMVNVLQAADRGENIETRNYIDGQWFEARKPVWSFHSQEYRVKRVPKFEPVVGQVVMVSEEGERWFPRVFKGIRWIGNSPYYKCSTSSKTGVWEWEFCRPLTTEEQGV